MSSVHTEHWIQEDIPRDKPNAARIYDYVLGGYHNFEADRKIAEKMHVIYPDMRLAAQVNRAFLRRAVNLVVEQGIDQILDLGSGIPTVGNVHQVAQKANPRTHVAYVDIDPVAVAHSRTMLRDNPLATAIRADVRSVDEILTHPEVADLLDLDRPISLLFIAVLHYLLDDQEAFDTVQAFLGAVASGSYLVIAHSATQEDMPEQQELRKIFGQASSTRSRTRDEIQRFFEGCDLVEPGLVPTPLWRPEAMDDAMIDQPHRAFTLAGVARKP